MYIVIVESSTSDLDASGHKNVHERRSITDVARANIVFFISLNLHKFKCFVSFDRALVI